MDKIFLFLLQSSLPFSPTGWSATSPAIITLFPFADDNVRLFGQICHLHKCEGKRGRAMLQAGLVYEVKTYPIRIRLCFSQASSIPVMYSLSVWSSLFDRHLQRRSMPVFLCPSIPIVSGDRSSPAHEDDLNSRSHPSRLQSSSSPVPADIYLCRCCKGRGERWGCM